MDRAGSKGPIAKVSEDLERGFKTKMIRMEKALLLGVGMLFLAWLEAGEFRIWGWRGDGTGRFVSADPPTEWAKDKNIVWKTPMPGWSNSCPILVGERIFVGCEPDILFCFDKATGKVLWHKPSGFAEAAPKEKQDEVRAKVTALNVLLAKIKDAKTQLAALKKALAGLPEVDRKGKEEKQIAEEEAKAASEKAKLQIPMNEMETKIAAWTQEAAPLEKEYGLPVTDPETGYSTPTPTSDGQSVFALFGSGFAAAYDLEGHRRWITFVERPKDDKQGGLSSSPLLVSGKLLIPIRQVTALDPADGRVLWRAPAEPLFGSPVALPAGAEGAAVLPGGEWLAAADGKLLAKVEAKLEFSSPLIANGIAFFIQYAKPGCRAVAYLPGNNGQGLAKEAWTGKVKMKEYYVSPLFHEDLLYTVNAKDLLTVLDAKTGAAVYTQKLDFGKGTTYPSPCLAGGKIYLSCDNGITVIAAPGPAFKELGRNDLGEGFRSTPVFEGSRIYVRGLQHMYSIGR